jgi:uncharacterized membrane protein
VHYLLEFFASQPNEVTAAELAARLSVAGSQEPDARWLHSIFVPEDETCYLVYEAGSVDAVAGAAARAGITYERIVAAFSATSPGEAT